MIHQGTYTEKETEWSCEAVHRVQLSGEVAMYDILLIIMGAVIAFLVVRIVIKVRALTGTSFDEEDVPSDNLGAQLSKELEDLKAGEAEAENWDPGRSVDKDQPREEKPPAGQP